MKEDQFEINSKESTVRNKWQPQLLIIRSHVGSNI